MPDHPLAVELAHRDVAMSAIAQGDVAALADAAPRSSVNAEKAQQASKWVGLHSLPPRTDTLHAF
jgi:hypothetical protein